jgi:ribonuclease HII
MGVRGGSTNFARFAQETIFPDGDRLAERVEPTKTFRIGVDENGLGARLGPLVVTAVLASVTEQGARLLARRPPKRLAQDLGDSKQLMSHKDFALGEAWARALLMDAAPQPRALFESLSLEKAHELRAPCPSHVEEQCWSDVGDAFVAESADVARIRGHLAWWAERGVVVHAVRSSVVCTKKLNDSRRAGGNRFISDLHAMERLILDLQAAAGTEITAVCGKVGGMGDYSRFFGPLSMRLHAVLAKGKAQSAYHFPGLGELRFVRDADAKDSLVMLASIVGKYVRELLMARVSGYYRHGDDTLEAVSGYHDPVTARFVEATSLVRKQRRIPDGCFERARDDP